MKVMGKIMKEKINKSDFIKMKNCNVKSETK